MASDAIHFLTIPPSRDVAEHGLPREVRDWFAATFGAPTLAQRFAWPTIVDRKHVLLSSPTGSGKTLAAFLPILCQIASSASSGLQCLYVAPLKALGRDVRANLRRAWRSLQASGCFPDVDLRVGLVKSAERVKGADKLLHLSVDIGEPQPRSIVAGIAAAYAPETLVGRKVVIVANLAPRKLRGLESQGMIVAASLEGGKPILAGFLEVVPIGARLK